MFFNFRILLFFLIISISLSYQISQLQIPSIIRTSRYHDSNSVDICSMFSKNMKPTAQCKKNDRRNHRNIMILYSNTVDDSEEVYRAKLKAEVASPFFRLRQFIYTAMVFGGGLATFTTITPFILTLQRGEDLNTIATNLAINVVAFASGIALWVVDGNQQQKKIERFTEKELRLSNKISDTESEARSTKLATLPVEIQISEFNETMTRIVPLGELQSKGKQNIIIFAGKRNIVKDAVITAKLEGSDLFVSEETMLVPVVLQEDSQLDDNSKKGFGTKEAMLSAPYFAKPTQINVWQFYLKQEVDLAIKQGEKDIVGKGLLLAIRKDGKVVRRGIGIPPWKTLVMEFKEKVEK